MYIIPYLIHLINSSYLYIKWALETIRHQSLPNHIYFGPQEIYVCFQRGVKDIFSEVTKFISLHFYTEIANVITKAF